MSILTMYRKHTRHLFYALLIGCMGPLVAACAPGQSRLETEATPPSQTTSPAVATHALEQEQVTDWDNPEDGQSADPWELVNRSAGLPPTQSNALLLQASELFLNRQHYSTAYTMFEQIDPAWLDQDQQQYYTLVRARYALLRGDPAQARALLNQIPAETSLSRENQARRLQLRIALAVQQRDFRQAVLARIDLDRLLGPERQLSNQQSILQTLSRERGLFPTNDPLLNNPRVAGWLSLAELHRQGTLNEQTIGTWKSQYPGHPARVEALQSRSLHGAISNRQIALLLPSTSRLGRAAQAFKAGFDAAAQAAGSTTFSREYDIGAETDLVGLYYQSAVNDGADFIVGPLGRSAAQALLTHLGQSSNPGVSTLLLGELDSEHLQLPKLWGLSLSPEQDATAIAERAISLGMRSAAVLQKNNDWGARLHAAFTEAFESRGGRVVVSQPFAADGKDHSAEVKKMLNINSSDLRHQRLENQLGTQLEFSVRRRDDIDFTFIAGNTRDARRLVPLLRFYRAHDLPVYATSSAFNGNFNRLTDEDLKGLQFVDLPWLLELQVAEQERQRLAAEQAAAAADAALNTSETPAGEPEVQLAASEQATPEVPLQAHERLPYSSATLNRLYALGYSAYQAIPQLEYLQTDEWYQFDTHTMFLNMDQARNLRHRVAWGSYDSDGISLAE